MSVPSPSPDDVRRVRDEVFRRPEFDGGGPSWAWLLRPLREFFSWLGGLYDASPVLFWAILIGCLVALAALLVLIGLQVRSAFVADGPRRDRPGEGEARRLRLSDEFRAEADRRAGEGDFTEAVRFLFLALVYRLDERGRVGFDKAYTNREYLALVGDRLPARDGLRVLVDALDDYWYGQRACGPDNYRACLAVYDRLAAA